MSKTQRASEQIKKSIKENCACYVLISCSEPNAAGKMEVEMHYEGDETLAAFLIDNAAQVFEDRFQKQESMPRAGEE